MTTYAKRLPIFAFAIMMLIFFAMGSQPPTARQVAQAQQATPSALPASKPTIRAALNGQPVEGIPGSFCWPSGSGSQCDFIDDPQPKTPVNVKDGDTITITVDPAQPAPEQMLATILDDQDIPADKKEQPLSNATFTVSGLGKGQRRVQIDVQYPGDAAFQPFVSFVILLNVDGQAASGTAVAQATPEATAAPTDAVAPTDAATPAPTEAPTQAATEAATETATAAPTEAATPEPTQVAATPAPTEAPTPEATQAPTQATAAPTAVSTQSVATAAATTPAPVQTVAVVPTAGVGGAAAVSATIPIYAGTLTASARAFEATAINACVVTAAKETICVDRATNAIRAFAVPNSAAQFEFKGPRPTAVTLTITTGDGRQVSKLSPRADSLILFNLPNAAGNYVITIEIAYPQGRATYAYQMAIVG